MNTFIRKGWRPLLVLILLFVVWEITTKLFDIPAWLMPAPSEIVKEGIESWPSFQEHLTSTTLLTIGGFIIGTSIGIGTAIGLHLLPRVREAVYPLMILSQNIPIIVLAPLLVIWFGFGLLPKLIVITLVCFFPVAVSALDGFRQTNEEYVHYMKMAGASKGQLFRKVEWPPCPSGYILRIEDFCNL